MKRLTLKNAFEMNMTELALNQVFVQDNQAWYLKEPENECSICDLVRGAAKTLDIALEQKLTDEELGDIMLDWGQFGETEPEGILAILYRALWAMAEVRERLRSYEDIFFGADGTELITLDMLRELRFGVKSVPLTLEELRGMKWEPAWVDGDRETEIGRSGWAILYYSSVEKYVLVCWPMEDTADIPSLNCYGDTWLAYRRRPEGTP